MTIKYDYGYTRAKVASQQTLSRKQFKRPLMKFPGDYWKETSGFVLCDYLWFNQYQRLAGSKFVHIDFALTGLFCYWSFTFFFSNERPPDKTYKSSGDVHHFSKSMFKRQLVHSYGQFKGGWVCCWANLKTSLISGFATLVGIKVCQHSSLFEPCSLKMVRITTIFGMSHNQN